jgi:hypothetical protein
VPLRINSGMLVIVLVALSVYTSLIAMNSGWTDSGFPYMNIADSVLVMKTGRIGLNSFVSGPGNSLNDVANVRSSRLVVVLLPVFLSQFTGIPVSAWTFFPFANILISLFGFLLIRELLSSEILGFVYGAYLALEPQGILRDYNMNIQGYGLLFFMAIVFVVSRLFTKEKRTRASFLLLTIFFVAVVLSYYSAEFYSLAFVILMSALVYLFHREDFMLRSYLKYAAVACLVITLGFEPIVSTYSQKLLTGGGKNVFEVVASFLNDVLRVLGLKEANYAASSAVSTPFRLLVLNTLLLIIIFLPILLAPFLIRKKRFVNYVFAALLITGALDFAAYSGLAGHVDLKFVYLFFPICGLVAVNSFSDHARLKRISMLAKSIFAVVLIAIVGLRFGLYASGPYLQYSQFNTHSMNQFDTIVQYSVSPCIYLTDNLAGGKLLISFAGQGEYNVDSAYQFASIQSIKFLYSGDPKDLESLKEIQSHQLYILVSSYALERSFPAQGWVSFPPFTNYSKILDVPPVDAIYQGLGSTVLIIP